MPIKRYTADADTIVTNGLKESLIQSGSLSNMGAADSLEVFYIFGQGSTSSQEQARSIIKFPVDTISSERSSGLIPQSGSVNFFIRLYNVAHPFTLPRQYTLLVKPVSSSWSEGVGLDLENFQDLGAANWISASDGVAWTTEGGDYLSSPVYSQYFEEGWEDLEIDITQLVEQWIAGSIENNGVGVMLTSSQESGVDSYYTKRFSARSSEYFYKRPTIEARWNDHVGDDRGNFYKSSSLASANDNLNTLYLYNYVRGRLTNIPSVGTGSIFLNVYTSASGGTLLTPSPNSPVTGGFVSTGVYSASFALDTSLSTVYDVWYSGSQTYHTGTVNVLQHGQNASWNHTPEYVINVTNLKHQYSRNDRARMRLFTRLKNWCPTVYTRVSTTIRPYIVENIYYKVFRTVDDLDVVEYGTGSLDHTKLSYDASGSYFDFNMDLLEEGYSYGIKFLFEENGEFEEMPQTFKFRVEK